MPNPQGYFTGHVRAPNKDHLISVKAEKWGPWLDYVKSKLNPPATWDSWTKGWIGPIKDQGQCGSCWDFSGTRVVETAFYKAGILKPDGSQTLSEEYTLSCGKNGGCNGDDNTTVLDWCKATGLPLSSDYGSYTASAGTCNWKQGMKLYLITAWGFAGSGGGSGVTASEDIKASIMDKGGVGCAVDAGFSDPGTGVISGGGNNIDHDVFLSGWNDTASKTTATVNPSMPASKVASAGWWWMDNSWGTGWGDKGRARITWGAYSIGTEAVWASVPGSSTINWIP